MYTLFFSDKPRIDFVINSNQRYVQNRYASLKCDVTGYPLPQVHWLFSPTNSDANNPVKLQGEDEVLSLYEVSSILEIRQVTTSGNVSCVATNKEESSVTQPFLVYEVQDGLGIQDLKGTWFPEDERVSVTCVASKYDFSNVTWIAENNFDLPGKMNYVEF